MSNTPWKNDMWYTSPWNFCDGAKEMFHFADNIQFHDVTLRDGEQQSGVLYNCEQKVALAEKMAEIGIHRIEAGFPVVSEEDRKAVYEICKRQFGPKVFTFSRCMEGDVELAKELGCDGVVMEAPANERLIKYGYKWPTEKAIESATKASIRAHELGLYVVMFVLDSSRSDWDYLTNFLDSVKTNGHIDSITVVDTVGGLAPLGAYFMVRAMKDRYPDLPIEFHAHDDFGVGSANTVMALAAGASVAHTSISAIGERSGNVSYEEVALQLLTCYGVDTGIKYDKMYEFSRYALKMSNLECRPNKGIIGPRINELETGLAVGWLENLKKEGESPLLMIPYLFSLTGHPDSKYTLGKHSGVPTLDYFLGQIGVTIEDKATKMDLLTACKEKAYEKGTILTVEELKEIVDKDFSGK